MAVGADSPGFGASHYTAVSVLSRVIWALTALYLVTVLPTAEYGQYAFVQIITGLTSQVVLGVFANIISSRIAALEPERRARLLLVAIGYAGTVVALAAMAALAADLLALTALGGGIIGAAAFWMFAGYTATVQTGYLLAHDRYGRAALVSILQPAIYLALVFGLPTASGELVALYAGAATLAPSLLAMLAFLRPGGGTRQPAGEWRAIAGDHRQSMVMNLATIPSSVVLLLVVNAIAAQDDPAQLAIYGVANQFLGLFFFLPAVIGGVAIPRLTRADAAGRRRIILAVAGGFIALAAACAVGMLLAVQLPFVPALLVEGKYEIAVALLVAGFATARSPRAWANQIGRHGKAESLSLLLNAVVLAPLLFLGPITSMAALLVRLAAAVASLAFSTIYAWRAGQ